MSSGVTLDGDVKEKYNIVKTGKKNPYVMFKLNKDNTKIIVDRVGEPEETFEDFRGKMMEAAEAHEARYAVYDLKEDQDEVKNKTGTLVFIVWISDDHCKIKEKMLYTSSKDVIKRACEGCYKEVQINDESDLKLNEILEKFKK